jgi:hypothetical protein
MRGYRSHPGRNEVSPEGVSLCAEQAISTNSKFHFDEEGRSRRGANRGLRGQAGSMAEENSTIAQYRGVDSVPSGPQAERVEDSPADYVVVAVPDTAGG